MPLKLIDHDTPDHKEMVKLRHTILRKPLGLDFSEEELEKEKNDILLGYFDDKKLEGCCLLTQTNAHEVRLRQMAVMSGLQKHGIGKALIQFAENIARDRGFQKICMHAREAAMGFYEKQGYQKTGDRFVEVTLPHFKMEKQLCLENYGL